jgi:hypothetical protein
VKIPPVLSRINIRAGILTVLTLGSLLFVLRGEEQIGAPGQKAPSSQEIILEVINRHFTVGQKIPSVYLRVFSDGTAECHTKKFWDEADVTKTKMLSANELEELRAVINDPNLLEV